MNGNHGIETPHTSTPLKPEYNYLQNYSRENNDLSQNNCQDEQNQKGTRFLGTKAVAVLNDWFHENRDYPYPDDATTDFLAKKAGWYFKIILNHLIYKLIIFF